MNNWVKKSIKIVESHGYLDKLSEIYPINVDIVRNIGEKDKLNLKKIIKKKNKKDLIEALLNFKKFPFDDPYVSFLRKNRDAIDKNPKTTARIYKKLIKMGFNEIIDGLSKPKSPSRMMGHQFSNWLQKLNIPILTESDFLESGGIAILKGSDKSLMKFAKKELGYKRKKGLDLVLKINDKFILGEAKLITAKGGTQDKSFREVLNFIKKKNKKFISIAILDGIVWLGLNNKQQKNLYKELNNLHENQIALSALLLKQFINSLNKK